MTVAVFLGIVVATMYVDTSTVRNGGKSYTRHLLRTSYRDNGRVRHRTIANLSHCSPAEIEAIRLALKHKSELNALGVISQQVNLVQGVSFGAVWVVYQIAVRLGITDVLGDDKNGRLALWQVMARVIDQGSRLSAVRLARSSACGEVLGLHKFDEDDLYENLDWLEENQEDIECKLFRRRQTSSKGIFLYDVTSSYLEGTENALASFGYNRDGKKGKKQIVIGLLCSEDGSPLSIEVFPGNTQDPKTVAAQIDKLRKRFGVSDVTLVGDKGMIKSPQMSNLNAEGYHYITAITKPQLDKLLQTGVLQMSLFDSELSEVIDSDGIRYVLRRNPIRAEEITQTRQEKSERLVKYVTEQNSYIGSHPRASTEIALKRVSDKIQRLALSHWVSCALNDKTLTLVVDDSAKDDAARLDGCYVLKTDLSSKQASKEIVHARYKDLAQVEHAFRTSKTAHLEMRPIYLRLEQRTRAHALVVMLAYSIIRHLAECWTNLDLTVEEGLRNLASLCLHDVHVNDSSVVHTIPTPRHDIADLVQALKLQLPISITPSPSQVSTKVNLAKLRKQ